MQVNPPHSPPEKLLETSGTHLTSCSFKYHYKGAPLFFSAENSFVEPKFETSSGRNSRVPLGN